MVFATKLRTIFESIGPWVANKSKFVLAAKHALSVARMLSEDSFFHLRRPPAACNYKPVGFFGFGQSELNQR